MEAKTLKNKLFEYVEHGNIAALRRCVRDFGADVCAKNSRGVSLVHIAVQQLGERALRTLKWLERKGAVLHVTSPQKVSIIHYAAKGGDVDILKWLESKGVNVKAETSGGSTAMHWAGEHRNPRAVKWLHSRGLDPDKKNDYGVKPIGMVYNDMATRSAFQQATYTDDRDGIEYSKYQGVVCVANGGNAPWKAQIIHGGKPLEVPGRFESDVEAAGAINKVCADLGVDPLNRNVPEYKKPLKRGVLGNDREGKRQRIEVKKEKDPPLEGKVTLLELKLNSQIRETEKLKKEVEDYKNRYNDNEKQLAQIKSLPRQYLQRLDRPTRRRVIDDLQELEKKADTCGICMVESVTSVFVPCLHVCCEACAPRISNCHLCKKAIDEVKLLSFLM